jgi:hypothetical protein
MPIGYRFRYSEQEPEEYFVKCDSDYCFSSSSRDLLPVHYFLRDDYIPYTEDKVQSADEQINEMLECVPEDETELKLISNSKELDDYHKEIKRVNTAIQTALMVPTSRILDDEEKETDDRKYWWGYRTADDTVSIAWAVARTRAEADRYFRDDLVGIKSWWPLPLPAEGVVR